MGRILKIKNEIAENQPKNDTERECTRLQATAELANRRPERVPELKNYLRDHPELHRYITSLSAGVKEGLLKKM